MSLVSDITAKVLRKLQDPSQDNYENDELLDYVNDCLGGLSRELANRRARLAREEDTTSFVYASGAENADLPDDFLLMEVVFINGEATQLKQATAAQIRSWEADASSGKPSHWWLKNNKLYVRPIPDQPYTLKGVYYPVQSVEASTDTMPWAGLFDDAIKWAVLAECYDRSELYPSSARAERRYEAAREEVLWRVDQREPMEIGMDIGSEADFVTGPGFFVGRDYSNS